MGTRNLTIVKMNNEYKVSQYGQWDGYPSGNGLIILKFLKAFNMEFFKEQLQRVKYLTNEEIQEKWVEAGANPDDEYVSLDVAERFKRFFPELSRDTGADILMQIIMSDKESIGLQEYINFAKDSLFCEWAYVIDLDTNKLEVYKGFNKNPLTKDDRFYMNGYCDKNGYYPVKLIASYDINNLPCVNDFLSDCNENDEDEEDL